MIKWNANCAWDTSIIFCLSTEYLWNINMYFLMQKKTNQIKKRKIGLCYLISSEISIFIFFKFVSLWIWLSKYCFRSLSWYSSGGLFKLQPAIFSNQKIMTIKFTIFIFVCCVDHRTFFSHWSFQYMVWSSWCFPISRRRLECRIVYSYNAHSSIRWWWFHQWTLCITSRYFWRKNIFKNFYLNPSMFHKIIWKGSIL